MSEFINVIAGRPGAGKTAFILKDIEDFIRDPEHIAVLIDYKWSQGCLLFFVQKPI